MGIDELLKAKREQIIAIAAKHGAYNLRIFGSVARGEADEKSDIDLSFLPKEDPRGSRWDEFWARVTGMGILDSGRIF